MKKPKKPVNKVLLLFLICVLAYQLFFLGFLIFYYREPYINPSVKPISYEYWTWLIQHPEAVNTKLAEILRAVSWITNGVCLFGLLYVLSSKEFFHKMKKWTIAAVFLLGFGLYRLALLLIRTFSPEYRMYMMLIPTEIITLILMFFILIAIFKTQPQK